MVPVPPVLLSLAALRQSLANSEAPPSLSRYVVRSACRDIVYDTTRAREQLGWQPEVTVEEGMQRAFGED